MDTDQPLGRLIRTIKKPCSECVSLVMQLRGRLVKEMVRGVEIETENEYYLCPACGTEAEILFRDKKKRIERIDKTAYVKPVDEKRGGNNGHSQPTRFNKSNGTSNSKSVGSYNKRSS